MEAATLEDVIDLVDPAPYWALLEERFGIAPETFAGYALVQRGKKKLYLVPRDHRPPVRPTPETIGLPFLRVQMAVPKLTTAAAMQFGMQATRNVIAATAGQAQSYLDREDITPSAEQLAHCTSRGYVIVWHDGWSLGVGFLDADPDAEPCVQSMFPKGWARSVPL